MPYVPSPNSGQSLGQTRDQIRNNVQSLKDSLAVNHVDLDLTGVGKHKFMQMPEQVSAPATAVDEGALYTKVASGTTQLFYRNENNGPEVQLTGVGTTAGIPILLSGTFASTSSFTAVTGALPANIYGQIFFYSAASQVTSSGWFFTNASKAFGFSNRIKLNGTSDDYPVELENSPASDLRLYGRRYSSSYGIAWNWKILYWAL